MINIISEKEINLIKLNSLVFCAPWMPTYKRYINLISTLENRYKNINFFGVNTDKLQNVCKMFNVISIPEILIFYDSQEICRITGIPSLIKSVTSILDDIYEKYNI
jgi:thioredoxin-like negative regulator of GroEL